MPLSSLSSPARRLAALALLPLVGTAALVTAAPTAQAVDLSSPVVISEVYGGGGNSGAPLTHDFIELYNNGDSPIDLTGWSVQYGSATNTTTWSGVTPLSGSIAPGAFFLVQEASGGTVGTPLPSADVAGSINLSASNGKVALVKNSTAPIAGCGIACSSETNVVDFVGFGTSNESLVAPVSAMSNTSAAQRIIDPFTNTGNNSTDFTVAAPTPKAPLVVTPPPDNPCAAVPTPPECVPGTTTIQDIQGAGFLSPQRGNNVDKVAGIVTAVRSTGSSRGFWIQQPTPDPARTAASSGIFVFTSTPAAVGDLVLVTGRVTDFYPLATGETVMTTSNLSITEITPTVVTVVSSGNPLPPPVVITATTVPSTFAPPSTGLGFNIETISPVVPTRSVMEFWEAHEGMLVTVNNVRVVGPGNSFGEIYVTTKPDENPTARGGTYTTDYDVPAGRLLVMPVSGQVPLANVGDLLSGATTGPVDWSRFGGYMVAATSVGGRTDNHLARTVATEQASDQLAVGTYNVENLAPGDADTKYARLADGIVDNLRSPEIVAVEEIQDNSGATDNGDVAADQTLAKLVAAISKAGGPTYQPIAIDPEDGKDGGQPGGNIRSVFLYNAAKVALAPGPVGDATTPVGVSTGADGTAELSHNPGRVDPTNSAWTASRKPLAAEFVFQGRKVIVVANHFNSKGGDQSADGRFQPPNRSSELQRTEQAEVLNTFVDQVLDADPNANVVLAGDFNDYQFAPSMSALTDDDVLTDLITTLPEDEQYTYVFSGVSQVLDHIFVTKPVTDVEYQVIHINAEFADQVSDHDPQVVRIRPTIRQGTLTLDPAMVTVPGTTMARLAGWYPNRTFTVTLDGSTTLGTVTTDATGAAIFPFPFPVTGATGVGTHTVSVTSATDGATASATLTLKATLGTVVLSPPKVKAGKQVKVELFGWSPGLPLTVLLDGTVALGTLTTDASGSAQLKVTIAAVDVRRESHQVVVRAADGSQVSAALEVSR